MGIGKVSFVVEDCPVGTTYCGLVGGVSSAELKGGRGGGYVSFDEVACDGHAFGGSNASWTIGCNRMNSKICG